jgi:hypothetical protein
MQSSQNKQVSVGVCLIVATLLLTGGADAIAAPATRIACGQCEEADRFVRLQAVTSADRPVSSRTFTHPFLLPPADWTSILKELHIQHQAERLFASDPQEPILSVFTEEEIDYLSVTLSKAFAQAQPNEWVVFGLNRERSRGLSKLTTGGWYLDGPDLHFVLANYRVSVTMSNMHQLLWEQPLHPDSDSSYSLIAGTQQTIVRAPKSALSLFTSSPLHLAIVYHALPSGQPVTKTGAQEISTVNQSPAPTPGTVSPPTPIEERLQALKRLYTQGLITEEEYRAKKQQLLERF